MLLKQRTLAFLEAEKVSSSHLSDKPFSTSFDRLVSIRSCSLLRFVESIIMAPQDRQPRHSADRTVADPTSNTVVPEGDGCGDEADAEAVTSPVEPEENSHGDMDVVHDIDAREQEKM